MGKQFYTQNGKTIEHPSYTVNGNQHKTITDDFCKDWVAEMQDMTVVASIVAHFGDRVVALTVDFFEESLMIQAGRLCRFLSMYKERPGLSIGRLNGAGRWWVALSVQCAPEWTDGKLGVFIKDGFLILVLIGFSKLRWLSLAGLKPEEKALSFWAC